MNYSRFLTSISQNRNPSLIRSLTSLLTDASPELVFLAGGLPNPNLFPFKECSVKLQNDGEIALTGDLMKAALQYGPTPGYPPLIEQLKSLTHRLHSPPNWAETDLLVLTGSHDGLCKTFEMTVNPKDFVIFQEPCYTGVLAAVSPYKPRFVPVEVDGDGMKPEALRKALGPWKPEETRDKYEGVPKVMYVNPSGCNPTGTSYSKERRKDIYKIACEYNLLIVEDDPYYFVQFDKQENYPPSFLSLDVEGRVLRFDSFSKILSSGLRLGFVTGPKPLLNRIALHMQCSVMHTSSLSQVLVSELLKTWGEEKFLEHTQDVQKFYCDQRDLMLKAAHKHLNGICEWNVPTGGMFLWMKVPRLKDTWDMVLKRGLTKNVMVVPGRAFQCNQDTPSNYMRAAFSNVSPDAIERGMKSLAELVKEEIERETSS